MSAATKRVLPADVYDALELSAEAYGGIGAGRAAENTMTLARYQRLVAEGLADAPYCVFGHAYLIGKDVADVLSAAGVRADTNDRIVWAINKRDGRPQDGRVPFAVWCDAMGVERGE